MMKLVQSIIFVMMLVLAALMQVNAEIITTCIVTPKYCIFDDNPTEGKADKVVEDLADAINNSRW